MKKIKEKKEQVQDIITKVGLSEMQNKLIKNLSRGQKQRVSIARALVKQPKILLADEPTGALNQTASKETMELFLSLKEMGNTILMVTHDAKVASYSDRILYLVDGSIAGEFNNLYRDENEVREFLASFRW